MPTKIRLQRKGKKGQPFYHLVVADGRAPRDGRFIERLGTYNPMTHPATIEIDFDRSLYWVQVGAQPTDTARSILSHKGVLMMHHLLKGATKGAFTEEQAHEKFQAWLNDKQEKMEKAKKDKELESKDSAKKKLEEERKVNETRAAELAKKRAKENLKVEEKAGEEAEAAPETAEPVAEVKEEPAVEAKEEPAVEAKEEPAAEAKEEPAVEAKEEPAAEVKEETKDEEKPEEKKEK